jgi:hypothetical protein
MSCVSLEDSFLLLAQPQVEISPYRTEMIYSMTHHPNPIGGVRNKSHDGLIKFPICGHVNFFIVFFRS